jgi:hypothetical protein
VFENPPTMKNSGITWKTQVRICSRGWISRRFTPVNVPFEKPRTAISQWPITTTPIATTRSRSTYRFLVVGVAPARSRAVCIAPKRAASRAWAP